MTIAILAAVGLVVLFFVLRSRELFVVSVRDGRTLVLRGRIPPTMLAEMRDVVAHPSVGRGTIKAVRTERGGRLVMSGQIDDGRQQRLRNIFHLYPVSQLRSAPAVTKPSLGQVLGISWLAWMLDSSLRR